MSKQSRFSLGHLMQWVLPMLWLAFVWCALWGNFTLPFIVFGLILAWLCLIVFRMPSLYISDRFNPLSALQFIGYMVWEIAASSIELLWVALTYRPPLRNSIVAVQLRTESDLWLTAVSHAMSLIPGSVVVEVDRLRSIIYFHVIDTHGKKDVAEFREKAHRLETMILKAVGSRAEYEAIKNDDHKGRRAQISEATPDLLEERTR